MAASAHLLLSALSKRPELHDLPAIPSPATLAGRPDDPFDPDTVDYSLVSHPDSGLEGSCAYGLSEPPLTSEPPLADAAPLTSEPPLPDTAPLTSEPAAAAAVVAEDALLGAVSSGG
ncbi:hypothetical protein C0Q58_22005 [Streptomyces albidoflavus]|uniref:hypothetical protein n=1 Tax=Streptomyces albidoflavus TaxID=1886 RepID=UPI00101E34B2|nr:hypothetical protein [Streptomyces albidoflavus]RZD58697.1 hypothetical protein C0Q58_22005 [Streptomyces albidoflavus]